MSNEFTFHNITPISTRGENKPMAQIQVSKNGDEGESQTVQITLSGRGDFYLHLSSSKDGIEHTVELKESCNDEPSLLEAITGSIDWNAVAGWVVVNMGVYLRTLF